MSATTTLEAGLAYIARGWPVIPLHHATSFGPKKGPDRATCSSPRAGCESQDKHPRTEHGLEDATLDPEVFARWLERWPKANLGIRTGIAFDALDIDSEDADRALGQLIRANGQDPATGGPMVQTGRGWQLYYRPTGHGNAAGLIPDVDWRGLNGLVVAPPSVHHTGPRYEWLPGCGPDEPLEPVPPWLADLLPRRHTPPTPGTAPSRATTGNAWAQAALEREVGRLALAVEGTRNHALNRSAYALGQIVAGGELDATEVASALLATAQRIGLGPEEAEDTFASGLSAGFARPRSRPA